MKGNRQRPFGKNTEKQTLASEMGLEVRATIRNDENSRSGLSPQKAEASDGRGGEAPNTGKKKSFKRRGGKKQGRAV